MYVRVTQKLQDIAARQQGQNVAVVLHGGVLDVINRFVRGNPLLPCPVTPRVTGCHAKNDNPDEQEHQPAL